MSGGRAVEPFEPILIEKRGERRLAEGHLPENPEKRGRRLVLLALERRQDRSAFGRVAIDGVRSRPEPKIGEGASPGRGQREMGDLMQNHIRLGRAVERCPIPIEKTLGPLRVDLHAKVPREREGDEAMPLGLRADGAVGRGRADPLKHPTGVPFGEVGHKAIEGAWEMLAWYRRQNHSVVR